MQRLKELTSPPIVGETYLVPCIRLHTTGEMVPVFGTEHADPELGQTAARKHIHVDQRFVSASYLRRNHNAREKQLGPYDSKPVRSSSDVSWYIIPVVLTCGGFSYTIVDEQPIKCEREMPDFSPVSEFEDGSTMPHFVGDTIDLQGAFDDKYENVKLNLDKSCMRCPHRGIHLGSIKERKGIITCPGHHMDFDSETGRMIRRTVRNADGTYKHKDQK